MFSSFAYAIHVPFRLVTTLSEVSAVLVPAGMLAAMFGALVAIVARSDIGRNWRIGVPRSKPGELVTQGLFGLSRNPVFFGMLTMAAGLATALPSPAMIACAAAFWAACRMQVLDEESFLDQAFGEEYRQPALHVEGQRSPAVV